MTHPCFRGDPSPGRPSRSEHDSDQLLERVSDPGAIPRLVVRRCRQRAVAIAPADAGLVQLAALMAPAPQRTHQSAFGQMMAAGPGHSGSRPLDGHMRADREVDKALQPTIACTE